MCIFVAVLLGFLLSLSLLREFPRIYKVLERFPNIMGFVPNWSFFAPTPGMYDYHLLYRRIDERGEVLDWEEAITVEDKRGISALLWNPEKKIMKSLIDITQELVRFSVVVNDKKQICLSIPYLHLLNFVSNLNHEPSVAKVQFMILSSSRMHDYNVEFMSSAHLLPRDRK